MVIAIALTPTYLFVLVPGVYRRPFACDLKWAFISRYRCNFAVTDRKAPAFLRGLLQFDLRLVEPAGIEPATSYLQIRLALFQTLPDSPFPEFIP